MAYRKKLADLYELASQKLPEPLLRHATILGFGRLGLSHLSDEKVSVDVILAPVIDGKRCLEQAHRLSVNVSNLGFLAARMPIIDKVLRGREVKNQFSIRVDLPCNYKPSLVSLSDLPIRIKWFPPSFREKFSDFFDSSFMTAEATRLDTKEEVNIFVPCSEILRFYFPHTSLVEAAFSGEAAEKALYNPEINTLKDDRPFVQLRKKIPDICAPHIARIRHSGYAEKIFNRIYTDSIHSVPPFSSGERLLKVYPPIQGKVDWVVEATELECGSLLISGIYQCDASFPFDELLFGRDNDGRSPLGREKPSQINYIPLKKAVFPPGSSVEDPQSPLSVSLDGMAEAQIETLDIEFDFEQDAPNFGGLSELPVKKIEKAAVKDPETMNVRVYVGEEAIAGVVSSGYLKSDNKDKFARAEISTGSIKKSEVDQRKRSASFFDAFDAFQNAIYSLKDEYVISWRKASVWRIPTKSSFYLNAFLPKEIGDNDFLRLGKKEFESSGDHEKFEYSRKFVIAEISWENKHVYFVDFEKRKMTSRDGTTAKQDSTSVLFFYEQDGAYLSNQQLKEVILQYADNRSGWPDKKTRFSLKHANDAQQFADKLYRRAQKEFSRWESLANQSSV